MNHTRHAIWLFCGALAYAVVRYHLFGDVAWANAPVYVANKALSWTGLALFGLSVLAREKADRRGYGMLAVGAVGLHVVLSVMVLNPAYFAKFYAASGRMNLTGEASMLAGSAGLALLAGLFVANLQPHGEQGRSLRMGWGRLVLVFTGLHVTVMGFAVWMAPSSWPGYLPPITLVSLVTVLYFLCARGR